MSRTMKLVLLSDRPFECDDGGGPDLVKVGTQKFILDHGTSLDDGMFARELIPCDPSTKGRMISG